MSDTSVKRVYALDVLRGIDIFLLVGIGHLFRTCSGIWHFPSSVSRQFTHLWGVFTLWDIIMPLFIFMCGAAVPLALPRRLADDRPTAAFWKHVVGRVALLWFLGMVYQGNLLTLDPSKIALFTNTLQAIAVGYFAAAVALTLRCPWFRRALPYLLVLVYSLALAVRGDYSQTGNAAYVFEAWLERQLPFIGNTLAGNYTWFLTSAMFAAMTLFGMQATEILQAKADDRTKVLCLSGYGAALLAVGWALVPVIPAIKQIYTASFTLQAMGWSMLVYALFYWLCDVNGWRRGTGLFVLFGQNALFAYMFGGIFRCCPKALADKVLSGLPHLIGDRLQPLMVEIGTVAVLTLLLVFKRRLARARKLAVVVCGLLLPCLAQAGGSTGETVSLVEKGQACATLIVPANAPQCVRASAAALSEWMERLTGARLPTGPVPTPGTIPVSFVLDENDTRVKHDGFRLTVTSKAVSVVARDPFGIAHAPYWMLNRFGKVYWCDPDCEPDFVKTDGFVLPVGVREENPLPDRQGLVPGGADEPMQRKIAFWNVRNGFQPVGPASTVREELGLLPAVKYGGHILGDMVVRAPVGADELAAEIRRVRETKENERLLNEKCCRKDSSIEWLARFNLQVKRHPERFPLIDGKRCPCGASLRGAYRGKTGNACLSNPSTRELILQTIRRDKSEAVRRRGRVKYEYDIMCDDTSQWCECDECLRLVQGRGASSADCRASDYWWDFANWLTPRLLEDRDVSVETAIYLTYRQPPTKVRPLVVDAARQSVLICPHGRCYFHSLTDSSCPGNPRFARMLEDWTAFGIPVRTFEYHCQLPGKGNYAFFEKSWVNDLKWYRRKGITHAAGGLFGPWVLYAGYEKGSYPIYEYGAKARWQMLALTGHFAWDADDDFEQVRTELLSRYYRAAAKEMLDYHVLLEKALDRVGMCMSYGSSAQPFLEAASEPGLMPRAKELLATAETKATNDAELQRRLARDRLNLEQDWGCAAARAAGRRNIRIHRTMTPPKLDGVLDESGWASAGVSDDFRWAKTYNVDVAAPDPYQPHTKVLFMNDAENLYLAFVCEKTAGRPERDVPPDGSTFDAMRGDHVEFVLQAPVQRGKYFHFGLSHSGKTFSALTSDPSTRDLKCPCAFRHAICDEKDRWIAEIAVPFKEFGASPNVGATWHVAAYRMSVGADGGSVEGLSTGYPLHWMDRWEGLVFEQGRTEPPYAFHAELETVHEADVRDDASRPSSNELVLADGLVVSTPKGNEFLARVAADFVDYLSVSQDVSARVATSEEGMVALTLDPVVGVRTSRIVVGDSGVKIVSSDERTAAQALYHLEDLMNLRREPFLKKGEEVRRMRYSPRMIHSGWAIDTFPESYLRRAAHHGFDAILVFVPEVGRTQRGWDDINAIVRRAKKWGIDTYLYSYVHAPVHPDDPKAPAVFRNTFGAIARAYPEARGYIFVGESCHFPSKDPRTNGKAWPDKPEPGDRRPYPGSFPCSDYPDWLKGVKAAINRESPDAEVVFWTYNFCDYPAELRLPLLGKMPEDVTMLVTFEMAQDSVKRNGLRSRVWDYSLSDASPSGYYLSEAVECGKLGRRFYTQCNTAGLTWDLGTVPYLPCPQQWKRRWDFLNASNRKHGLSGLMEGHHYGWYPSFITELSKEAFTEGGIPFAVHLRRIAARDFGEANVEAAVCAWQGLSEAIADAYPCPQNLAGPYRIGPAFPFNFGGKRIAYEDVPFPKASAYVSLYCWTYFNYMEDFAKSRNPPVVKTDWEPDQLRLEIELLADMVRKADAAADTFADMIAGLTARQAKKAQKMSDLARYMGRCWTTVRNLKRGALVMLEKNGDRGTLLPIAREEYANKLKALDLVRRDSRLGWEPSMDYMGGADIINWSLGIMETTYGAENLR